MFEISIFLTIIIFMFGSFLKGWSGFGTTLVVPPLLLFLSRFESSKEVMVIVISLNLFLNLYMIIHGKRFNVKFLEEILILVFTAVAFNFLGAFIFSTIDDSLFKVLFGSVLILATLNRIYKLKFHFKELKASHYLITGIIAGTLNGMFGLGGIPVLILLSSTKMDKEKFKSTLVSFFFVMNVVFIISQLLIGGYNTFVISNILIVFVFAVLSCMFGVYLSSRVSDKLFHRVMNFVLIFFGVNLIYSGIVGQHIFTIFS